MIQAIAASPGTRAVACWFWPCLPRPTALPLQTQVPRPGGHLCFWLPSDQLENGFPGQAEQLRRVLESWAPHAPMKQPPHLTSWALTTHGPSPCWAPRRGLPCFTCLAVPVVVLLWELHVALLAVKPAKEAGLTLMSVHEQGRQGGQSLKLSPGTWHPNLPAIHNGETCKFVGLSEWETQSLLVISPPSLP